MNNLNLVVLEGNLTRDPETAKTDEGVTVCRMNIACNRTFRLKANHEKQSDVGFFDVSTFGDLADSCATHLTQGRGVRVTGRLKQDRWMTPSGEKRSKVVIHARDIEFMPVRMGGPEDQDQE